METLRKSSKLAFVIIFSMFCGVGCIAETDAEVLDEVDNAAYETQDPDVAPESNGDDEEPANATGNASGGVCPPPCTKI